MIPDWFVQLRWDCMSPSERVLVGVGLGALVWFPMASWRECYARLTAEQRRRVGLWVRGADEVRWVA